MDDNKAMAERALAHWDNWIDRIGTPTYDTMLDFTESEIALAEKRIKAEIADKLADLHWNDNAPYDLFENLGKYINELRTANFYCPICQTPQPGYEPMEHQSCTAKASGITN